MDRHETYEPVDHDEALTKPGPARADGNDRPASRAAGTPEPAKPGGGGKRSERQADDDKPDDDKPDDSAGNDGPKKPLSPLAKIAIALVVVIVLLAAIAYGVYWWLRGSYYQSTNDAYLQADQVSIAPRISGFVDEVLVGDNQEVAAGQVLVRISDRDYRARIEQDRAQIAEAQASVVQTEAKIRQQSAQIAQSEAQATQSRAQERQYAASAEFNDAEARRYRPLAASGAETSEKLASYVSQARQSRAQLDASHDQAAADAAKAEYSRRQLDIYQAEQVGNRAKIQHAQAQLAADQVDVDAANVVSSIAGRVGDRTVRVGQYLQPGTRVMTIVPVDSMYLKANFKETQIGLMRIGQPVRITVDALSSMVLHGTVESFSPGTGAQFSLIPTDNATGNFTKVTQRVPVRIHVDAGPQARKVLVPGLSVSAEVDTISAKDDLDADAQESRSDRASRTEDERLQNSGVRQNHDFGAGHD